MEENTSTETTPTQEATENAPVNAPNETAATTPADATGAQDRPFLGEPAKANEAEQEAGKEKPAEEATKGPQEADYLAAMKKDEALLGTDENLRLDAEMYKAMIPKAQELGVSPENMNKLANAMAKVQIEQAREQMKGRIEYFTKMKNESMQKYSQKDFETINAGIDKWFKPNGVMNHVIRNSELGADPEFLALMHHLGASVKADGLAGAGSGAGTANGDANGIDGLATLW